MNKVDHVLDILRNNPKMCARDMAAILGIERRGIPGIIHSITVRGGEVTRTKEYIHGEYLYMYALTKDVPDIRHTRISSSKHTEIKKPQKSNLRAKLKSKITPPPPILNWVEEVKQAAEFTRRLAISLLPFRARVDAIQAMITEAKDGIYAGAIEMCAGSRDSYSDVLSAISSRGIRITEVNGKLISKSNLDAA